MVRGGTLLLSNLFMKGAHMGKKKRKKADFIQRPAAGKKYKKLNLKNLKRKKQKKL